AGQLLRDGLPHERAGERTVDEREHHPSVEITVPARPSSAATPSSSAAITARSPPAFTNSTAARTLGLIDPSPNSPWASRRVAFFGSSAGMMRAPSVPYPSYTPLTSERTRSTDAWTSRASTAEA